MLENFLVHMTALDRDRVIRVYLPESYPSGDKRYPVLYMHDGQNVFEDAEAIHGVSLGMKAYLEETGAELIVVGIDSNRTPVERVNELHPWPNGEYSKKILEDDFNPDHGGLGGAYLDFVVHELKPLIDEKYRTLPDQTSMAGISSGGVMATYAACLYPHIFRRVVGLSSAFYRNQEEIEALISQSDLSAMEGFYLDCGTKEAGNADQLSAVFAASNQSVYKLLQSKVPHAKFQIIDEGRHNYTAFRNRVPELFSVVMGQTEQ